MQDEDFALLHFYSFVLQQRTACGDDSVAKHATDSRAGQRASGPLNEATVNVGQLNHVQVGVAVYVCVHWRECAF